MTDSYFNMSKQAFNDFVQELALHFGQDKYIQPSDMTSKRLKSWYNQVQTLPDDCLQWISDKIKNSYEWFPRNLSKTVIELYETWKKETAYKTKTEQVDCGVCFNSGWIVASYLDKRNYWQSVAFRCGHCKRLQNGAQGVMATLQEVQEKGFKTETLVSNDLWPEDKGINHDFEQVLEK